jgi:probable H4MPT-linked C1 transfer pathway protein
VSAARTLGLDIGGANLKAADADGRAESVPFPVWKDPDGLADALRDLIARFDPADRLAITMTAELADCFRTKAEGVDRILRAVEIVAAGRPVHVWQTGAEFVAPDVAREIPLLVAAANWHALATWIGRSLPVPSFAVLIDVGSTTTDILPLHDGVPVPVGMTDVERLLSGELLYTGARRTPLCAVARRVLFRGRSCPVAAELFATTLDVHLLTDGLPENAADTDTADGRPATKACAQDRIARLLCCDRDELGEAEAVRIAQFLADTQRRQIAGAIDQVLAAHPAEPTHALTSGSGSFLADRAADAHPRLRHTARLRLSEMFPAQVATAACAFAVARLATEREPFAG